MDPNRRKYASEWFYNQVFRDETITPRNPRPEETLPPLLRTARSLENSGQQFWQSRESVFLKQGKLLANYVDEYEFSGSVVRYFPTYQSLTDRELRGYFAWRTKLRRGQVEKTSLSFAFLYIYELLNQIGVADALDGYEKLKAFRDSYSQLDSSILSYLKNWMTDYVIYNGLDPALLAELPQVLFDRAVAVLDQIHQQPDEKILWAVKQLAPKWLSRSRFYAAHQQDMNRIIVRVLGRIWDHCDSRCKKSMVEQYFGSASTYQVRFFESAVFCDRQDQKNREYVLDERCVYRCVNGLWSVTRQSWHLRSGEKLEDLLKTIDGDMRLAYGDKHPIKVELDTKWVRKIIAEEIAALQKEKQEAEARKIHIDRGSLARIRSDAAITRDKLIVEEEEAAEIPEPEIRPEVPETENIPEDSPLDAAEYRLMQCLLYGRDYGWVRQEGKMLSVLLDSINDKLYDVFLDSVLDDTPAPVEDYIDDLKEMIKP